MQVLILGLEDLNVVLTSPQTVLNVRLSLLQGLAVLLISLLRSKKSRDLGLKRVKIPVSLSIISQNFNCDLLCLFGSLLLLELRRCVERTKSFNELVILDLVEL